MTVERELIPKRGNYLLRLTGAELFIQSTELVAKPESIRAYYNGVLESLSIYEVGNIGYAYVYVPADITDPPRIFDTADYLRSLGGTAGINGVNWIRGHIPYLTDKDRQKLMATGCLAIGLPRQDDSSFFIADGGQYRLLGQGDHSLIAAYRCAGLIKAGQFLNGMACRMLPESLVHSAHFTDKNGVPYQVVKPPPATQSQTLQIPPWLQGRTTNQTHLVQIIQDYWAIKVDRNQSSLLANILSPTELREEHRRSLAFLRTILEVIKSKCGVFTLGDINEEVLLIYVLKADEIESMTWALNLVSSAISPADAPRSQFKATSAGADEILIVDKFLTAVWTSHPIDDGDWQLEEAVAKSHNGVVNRLFRA